MKTLARKILNTPLAKSYLYRWAYWKNIKRLIPKLLNKPRRLIVENTNLCNLKCWYCGNPQMKRPKGTMSNEMFYNIVDQAKEIGIEHLYAFGIGEPLLDEDYNSKVLYASSFIPDVHCVTNGTLLTYLPFVDYLGVTINDRSVIPNLKKVWLQRRGKLPFIEARLKEDTEYLIPEVKPYCDKVDVYINVTNWGKEVKGTTPMGIKFPCSDLWSTLYICWDGRVALCCKDYECSAQIGDLKTSSLKEIWESKELAVWRGLHLQEKYNYPCDVCLSNTHLVNPWWRVEL